MYNHEVSGFLTAHGTELINEAGDTVILRGTGLGSWLLPEGYMLRLPEQGDRPGRIEHMIRDLIGEEQARNFWKIYYENYITETDIQKMAAEGFNSVRVPILYRVLETEYGFTLLDNVIRWCKTHSLYVILDLHGAPGGQTGTNIDDSEHDRPELFLNEKHQHHAVEIWKTIASRYKDEWIVAGYDLLNEPLPEWFSEYNSALMPLYERMISAIRSVDTRHLIILEGTHWATDWTVFTHLPDSNLMLQFHKYWNNPDTESIQQYLEKRDHFQVPIFMGEGGENNTDWYTGAFRMYEDHGISWNFWTWKKMDTGNSPCSIRKPEKWDLLVNYLNGVSSPSPDEARKVLWEYLTNMLFEHCEYRQDVINALFRRAPVRIPAVFYGCRGAEISYHTNGIHKRHVDFRRNDGTSISFVGSRREQPNFQHTAGELWEQDEWLCLKLEPGEWAVYDFTVREAEEYAAYCVEVHQKAEAAGNSISIEIVQKNFHCRVRNSGVWSNDISPSVRLQNGDYSVQIKAEESPVSLAWLRVRRA